MRSLAVVAASLAILTAPMAADARNDTGISQSQSKWLRAGGVDAPVNEALGIATILIDRKFAETESSNDDVNTAIIERWTRFHYDVAASDLPCDVTVAKCRERAKSVAGEFAPKWIALLREAAILHLAHLLSRRYDRADWLTLKAFVLSPAGRKTPLGASFERDQPAPEYARVAASFETDIAKLEDGYRRRFLAETASFPKAEQAAVAMPPSEIKK